MKILIATIDDTVFLPQFYEEILAVHQPSIFGIIIFPLRNKRVGFFRFLGIQLKILGCGGLMKIIATMGCRKVLDVLPGKGVYSLKKLARKYALRTFSLPSMNCAAAIDLIKNNGVDVVLCSINEILGEQILGIETATFFNRHFGLLPAYRGLWPLYWALRNREAYCGVTIHTMTKTVDSGLIVKQEKIKIEDADTYLSLTEKCFAVSPRLMHEALSEFAAGTMRLVEQDDACASYYSDP